MPREAIDFILRHDEECRLVIEGTYIYEGYTGENGVLLGDTPFNPKRYSPDQVRDFVLEWASRFPGDRLVFEPGFLEITRMSENEMSALMPADYHDGIGSRWADARGVSLDDVYLLPTVAQEQHFMALKRDGSGWVYIGTDNDLIEQMGYELPSWRKRR